MAHLHHRATSRLYCYGKDFDFEEDDQGNVFKSIPMSEEMAEILQE